MYNLTMQFHTMPHNPKEKELYKNWQSLQQTHTVNQNSLLGLVGWGLNLDLLDP